MNRYLKLFPVLAASVVLIVFAVSCDSFLDRQEDERMTFDKIWEKRSSTESYFYNVMGYLPRDAQNETNNWGLMWAGSIASGATDEGDLQWANAGPARAITQGSWSPNNLPAALDQWFYAGIRDANIFLANVDRCQDTQVTESDRVRWKTCVRWARAYFYFMLMRNFGPVILVGDEVIDTSKPLADLARPRSTWDECVDYVVSEMKYCADNLSDSYNNTYMGLPTKGAALAVISRLTLYSARPLFNGNALYRPVVNPDGTPLFSVNFDAQKWLTAAEAAKAVIDLHAYSLYHDESDNPYLNYYGVFQETWNDELIYCGGGYDGRYTLAIHCNPYLNKPTMMYGGWGPTQQQVDAYAMNNGKYPITGYKADGSPIVDSSSGYPTDEFTTEHFTNPFLSAAGATAANNQGDWPVMYKDREPRFYVSIFWGDSKWWHGDPTQSSSFDRVSFCRGTYTTSGNDWPNTGYLVYKWVDHTLDTYNGGGWGNITFPTFRLGEIYLNYIEAVLECERNGVSGEAVNHEEAMQLWSELRARSGMAPITDAYPEATGNYTQLIDLVRKERRVELAFENHRHFDTRTWMIAEDVDGGPMYGMNIMARSGTDETVPEFWQRYKYSDRVFRKNHYLWPFRQTDLERNRQLVQNYGW